MNLQFIYLLMALSFNFVFLGQNYLKLKYGWSGPLMV